MITDPGDPRLAPFTSVRERDLKREDGLFLGEGPLTVETMLRDPGAVRAILVSERWAGRYTEAEAAGVTVLTATDELMSSVLGFPFHRGVIAAGERKPFETRTLENCIRPLPNRATVLLVDGVTNVDNIGLLFRNAAAFGCGAVVLSPSCCDPLYRKALRVSLGHVLSLPWCVVDDWQRALSELKAAAFELVAAALTPDAVTLDEYVIPDRIALVVGQERHGVSPETIEACEAAVKIPMAPGVDSLNVAAASAVCLHALSHGERD